MKNYEVTITTTKIVVVLGARNPEEAKARAAESLSGFVEVDCQAVQLNGRQLVAAARLVPAV